jgi:formylglycine-generating enzyme required for sulfatase activity
MGTSTTFPYRGGCWISSARFARSAIRFRHDTTGIHFPFLGFRPAADAAPLAFRVLRGGCWISSARNARSAYRGRGVPGNRYKCLGFRPVEET